MPALQVPLAAPSGPNRGFPGRSKAASPRPFRQPPALLRQPLRDCNQEAPPFPHLLIPCTKILLWRPNEFPYAFPADVSHDLLWSTGELTEEIILEEIEREKPASRCGAC